MSAENIFEQGGSLESIFGKPTTPNDPVIPTEPPVDQVPVVPATDPVGDPAPSDPIPPVQSWEDILKERSAGRFNSWDDIEAGLAPKEPEFANEGSKKVFDLLKAGKIDEVVDTYNHQRALGNLGAMDDLSVIKLAMKYKDSSLTDADIQSDIDDMLALDKPEKPIEDDYLTDEEYQRALKTYNKEQASYEKGKRTLDRNIRKQATEARSYLEGLKADIVLPDLPGVVATAEPQPTPEQIAAHEAKIRQIQDAFEYAKSNFRSHNFKFSEDGVEFETGYDVSEAAVADMLDRLSKESFTDILQKRYIKGDGTFDAMKMMEELHYLENRDAIRASDIRQARASATHTTVKNIKNIDLDQNGKPVVPAQSAEEKFTDFARNVLSSY